MSLSFKFINKHHKSTIGLIHGFGFTSDIWEAQTSSLSSAYNLLIIDTNNMRNIKEGFSLKDISDEIIQIQKAVCNDPLVWFGHSMGGYILAEMVINRSNYIKGASWVHSHVFGDSEEKQLERGKQQKFVLNYGPEMFFKQMISQLFFDTGSRKTHLNNLINKSKNISPEYVIDALEAMKKRGNTMESVQRADIKIQLILGDKDPLLSLHNAKKMFSMKPLCNIAILKNCGHVGMLEKKKVMSYKMIEFSSYCFNL